MLAFHIAFRAVGPVLARPRRGPKPLCYDKRLRVAEVPRAALQRPA